MSSLRYGSRVLLLMMIGLLVGVQTLLAEPNAQINYQGKLTDSSGVAVADGTYNMAFKLYTTGGGSTAVWSSTTTVPVVNGLFSYMLGSDDTLSGVNFNQTLYLGVNIGGVGAASWDGEMTPRKILGTVPAAFEAFQVGGVASSSFLRSDQADVMTGSSVSALLAINQTGAGDILNLLDDGTEVFTVTDGGNVGIGTTTIPNVFAIDGESNVSSYFTSGNTTGSTLSLLSSISGGVTGAGIFGMESVINHTGSTAAATDMAALLADVNLESNAVHSNSVFASRNLISNTSTSGDYGDMFGGYFSALQSGGGGSSVNNLTGLYIEAGNYGGSVDNNLIGLDIYVDGAAAGAKYGIRQTESGGAAVNYFQSSTGIGTSSPMAELSVDGDFALTGGLYDNSFSRGISGQLLQTNGSGVNWVGTSSLGLGDGTFAGLSDTSFSGLASGELAQFNGTNWVNVATSSLGLPTGDTFVTVATADTDSSLAANADYVGDGTADDVQIQAAIDAVFAMGGGTVELLEGTYDIAATVVVGSSTILEGQGKSITKLVLANAVDDPVISMRGAYVGLQHLSIDGNGSNQSSADSYGIEMGANMQLLGTSTVLGVEVYNARKDGILAGYDDGSYVQILDSHVHHNGVTSFDPGITFGMRFGVVHNTVIESNSGYGIRTNDNYSSNYNVVFSNNTITNNGNEGLYLDDSSYTDGSIAVTNNQIAYNTGDGVSAGYAYHVTLSGNNVYENGGYGLNIYNLGNSAVSGNTISNNTLGGIYRGISGYNVVISGNQISENDGHGLFLEGHNDVVTGNQITDFTGTASSSIYVSGDENLIANNYISAAGSGFAIEITAAASETQISNNKFYGTGASAISDLSINTIYDEQDRVTLTNRSNTEVGYNLFNITGSSSVALASLQQTGTGDIFSLLDSAGDSVFMADASGNIGVGTSSPNAKLTVAGDINIDDPSSGISFMGTRMFYASTTNDSIVIGELAGQLYDNATLDNVAIGYLAARDAYVNDSVAIGSQAGRDGFLGASILIGSLAGRDGGVASSTVIGYQSALFIGASNSTVIGSQASRTGFANQSTIIGERANYNTSASGTVVVGNEALYGSGGSSNNTSALGYRSGYSLTTGGNNNLLLGYQAADSLTTGANNIIIGYDVEAPSNTGSNQLNIGNLLFGTGIDGTGTTLSSGNIGIGTSSPNSKLTVAGDGYFGGALRATGTVRFDALTDGLLLAGSTGILSSVATSSLGLGDGTFAGLSDTSFSGLASGELAQFNGTNWVNVATSSLGLPTGDTVVTVAANDTPTREKANADYVSDGTADEVQIQAAIDSLGANGGVVQLLPGTFTIATTTNNTYPIILSESVALIGSGASSTILVKTVDTGFDSATIQMNGAFSIVRNLQLQNTVPGGNIGRGLQISAPNTEISGVVFNAAGDDAVLLSGAGDKAQIFNNQFLNGDGINATSGADDVIVSNNVFDGGGSYPEAYFGSGVQDRVIFTNNSISGTNNGFGAFSGMHNSVVSNNTFFDVLYYAVYFDDGDSNVISDNTFSSTSISNASAIAFGFNGESDNVITGNTFEEVAIGSTEGIIDLGNSDRNIVSNNTFRNTTGSTDAIHIASGGNDNQINNNYISGAGIAALVDDSGTNTIYDEQDRVTLTNRSNTEVGYNLFNITGSSSVALASLQQTGTGDILDIFDASDNTAFTILNNGNVGIGTTSPNAKLTVAGDINIIDTASANGGVSLNGVSLATGSTTANNYFFAGATSTSFSANSTYNLAFGAGAMNTLSTFALNNVAIGRNALFGSTTVGMSGDFNAAIGWNALMRNTSGRDNVAIGRESLAFNTDGDDNIAIGGFALQDNTTGFRNVAVGRSTLTNNLTGIDNVAIGYASLLSNTSGSDNVALGLNALYSNSSGDSNMAFGSTAMQDNQTGSYNIAFGVDALGTITTGNDNIALGFNAMWNTTNANRSIAFGNSALANNVGTGTIALGYGAADNATGVDRGIFIGYNIDAFNTTENDVLNIGNLIFGQNVDGTGTTLSSGNIGIGTSSPNAKLTVAGDINIDDPSSGISFMNTRYLYASSTNRSISFGANAGAAFNALRTNNIALGTDAGSSASTTDSVFIGDSAGASTEGDDLVAIGNNAGYDYVGTLSNLIGNYAGGEASGNNNNFIGVNAGWDSSGNNNNFIGEDAGAYNTGSQNTMFGLYAGGDNTGSYNNLLGYSAGYANTGSYNNILGYQAGAHTLGSYNEFIGYEAAGRMNASNTIAIGALALHGGAGDPAFGTFSATTTNNTVIGYGAGYNVLTGGDNNILLGYQAADSLTTGANNIIIGYDVEAPSNTGSNQLNIGNLLFGTGIDGTGTTLSSGNIGIGTSSPNAKLTVAGEINIDDPSSGISFMNTRYLYASSTNDSIAFGENAGATFNSGTTYNVALGFEAGQYASTSDADYGVYIGHQAGRANTGQYNVMIGDGAAELNTGTHSNFMGKNAGRENTGSYNNIIGTSAGWFNSGYSNTFLGYLTGVYNAGNFNTIFSEEAGYNNTGSYNNILGYRAGYNNIGDNNNFFGNQAGYANTGDYNELIGYETGRYLQSTSSVAIGAQALFGPGSNYISLNNVALGYRAGYSSDDGSGNNILLGYQAADSLTTGANNIIIGYDVEAPSNTGSNQLNIGNLLFGTGIDGTGTTLSSGNIGIGTSSPASKLDVWGDFRVGTSGDPTLFVDTSANAVAIGTSTPWSSTDLLTLDMRHGRNAMSILTNTGETSYLNFVEGAGGGSGSYNIEHDGSSNSLSIRNNTIRMLSFGGDAVTVNNGQRADVDFVVDGDINRDVFMVDVSTERVGIGTSTPTSKLSLDVGGFTGAGTAALDQYIVTENASAGAVQLGNQFYLNASNTATTTLVGSIYKLADNTAFGNTLRGLEVQADRGSNTQGENTALSGFARTFGVRGYSSGDAGGSFEPAGGFFETGGSTLGNAIRGYSSSITTSELLSLFQDTSDFTGTGLQMNFGNSSGSFASTSSKFVDFQNAGTSKFTVTAQGTTTIGDGTTNNMAGLQIGYGGLCVDNDGSCNASTTGRISSVSSFTGNSDLAEMYFSSQSLTPGELVYTQEFLSVGRASQATAAQVIGVVSTKPGLLLGADDTSLIAGQRGYPIALSGRVPVQLSTENGAIEPGDPLMLSSIPGVAMKATNAGQIVGRALESFDGTYAYTDGFVDQFGDDIAAPLVAASEVNTDSTETNPCYFGAGGAADSTEEACDPSDTSRVSTSTPGTAPEVQQARYEAKQVALAQLRAERAKTRTVDGKEVRVGQIIMFVDLGTHLRVDQNTLLDELVSTSTELVLGTEDGSNETLWSRLKSLAQGFVDGVLTITGIKTERVETTELCVDEVCIGAAELRTLLESTGSQPAASEASTAPTSATAPRAVDDAETATEPAASGENTAEEATSNAPIAPTPSSSDTTPSSTTAAVTENEPPVAAPAPAPTTTAADSSSTASEEVTTTTPSGSSSSVSAGASVTESNSATVSEPPLSGSASPDEDSAASAESSEPETDTNTTSADTASEPPAGTEPAAGSEAAEPTTAV